MQIHCDTSMTDEEGEALYEKINAEAELGLEAIKTNLKGKFPEIVDIQVRI